MAQFMLSHGSCGRRSAPRLRCAAQTRACHRCDPLSPLGLLRLTLDANHCPAAAPSDGQAQKWRSLIFFLLFLLVALTSLSVVVDNALRAFLPSPCWPSAMYASQKSAAALAAGKPLVDASGKELKPTLSSGPVRTRKRNIQTKRDPEAFRNRLLEVFDEAVRFFVQTTGSSVHLCTGA